MNQYPNIDLRGVRHPNPQPAGNVKQTPIDIELEMLGKTVAAYEETLAVLYSRLDPVLQPAPPTPAETEGKEAPLAHGLMGRLQVLNRKLQSQNQGLQDIIGRLTI